MKITTRIAPSPTGLAHIGTAYTALFNFAFSKKQNGKFLLRIEDTDQKRNVKDGEKAIFEGLKWLGLNWDGEPVIESERLDIYKKYVQKLLSEDKAYKEDGGVMLKVPNKDTSWNDLVRGEITFPKDQIKNFAIQKKDGFPTYNFAVVVDDHEMGITHVIRAEDHISNTPRQIAAYNALGLKVPEFAHIPLLRNKDKSKISKRKNPISISWYKKEGYLPEALVNFLCLLGWSHPEAKEKFSLQEFIENFSLDRVQKTGPVFNIEKLDWLNKQYIQELNNSEFAKLVKPLSSFKDHPKFDEIIKETGNLVKPRISTLKEFDQLAGFYFGKPKPEQSLYTQNSQSHLNSSLKALESVNNWSLENINEALLQSVKQNNFHTGKFFMDLRIAIAGKKVTPPINESIAILGKEETIKRIKTAHGNSKD